MSLERRLVAERLELGVRVCFPLHGNQRDNAVHAETRTLAVAALCHLAGHDDTPPMQLTLEAA